MREICSRREGKQKVEQGKAEQVKGENIKINWKSQEKSCYEGKENKGLYPSLADEVRLPPYATQCVHSLAQ